MCRVCSACRRDPASVGAAQDTILPRSFLTQKPPVTKVGAEPPPGGPCLFSRGPGLTDRVDGGASAQGWGWG